MKSPTAKFDSSNLMLLFRANTYNTMILNFNVNFNNYKENILEFYGVWDYKCPSCNAFRSFSRHATYPRNICVFSCGNIIEEKIDILRLMCNSCKTTHAVLPADTVPYMIYSFSCIMHILTSIYVETKSVLKTVEQLKISFQLVYSFIKMFNQCIMPCINFLRVFLASQLDFNSSYRDILNTIHKNFDFIAFQYEYLSSTKTVFLVCRSQYVLSKQIFIGSCFRPPT